MAHPKPDFTIKWGTLDEPIAPIADIDQNNGWSFLGNTPPTAAQFDYMMALYDKRDAWLQEQLPSDGTTAYIRTLLDDPDAATARGTLGVPFTATLGESGSYTLPGGFIVQWGRRTGPLTGSSGTETFPFNVAYPNSCLLLMGGEIASDPNGASTIFGRGANTNTTTAEIHWRKDSGSGFAGTGVYEWFSIGH